MNKFIYTCIIAFVPFSIIAQNLAVNNSGTKADSSAMLDVSSLTKGFLPPRMNKDQIKAIKKPAEGLIVYNITAKKPAYFDGQVWRYFDDSLMTPPVNGVNVDKATDAINNYRTNGFNAYPKVNPVTWNDTLSNAALNFAKDVAIPGNEVNTYTTANGGIIFNYPTVLQYNSGTVYFALCYFFPSGTDEKTIVDQGFTQFVNDATVIGGLMNIDAKQMGMGYNNGRYYLLMSK